MPSLSIKGASATQKWTKAVLVVALVVAGAISCINPPYPEQTYLQHAGTLLLLLPLICDAIGNRLPLSTFVGVALFVVLHIVGARYIYSYVPYADWLKNIGFNAEFCHSLGESRNHYDRLVHFSFGLFLFSFFQYKAQKWVDRKPLVAIFMAWLLIQTLSMVYEIFEWLLTIWSEAGLEYNGQQGDPWDAQKDMMLAMLGSTIMAVGQLIRVGSVSNRFLSRIQKR